MKKNIRKHLSVILTAAIITGTLSTAMPSNVYAYTVDINNNAYYTEVSGIAASLTANFKDETERKCCYDAIMTSVFGERYNDWDYHREENDLICVVDENASSDLLHCFIGFGSMISYFVFNDGKRYYCLLEKTALNQDDINEENYVTLKAVYQAAEMLKAQTEGMNVTDKARHIHDYMVARYNAGDKTSLNQHSALWMEKTGDGICSAYTAMFMILSRYCGLNTGGVAYRSCTGPLHSYNTVILENGEIRYIDVMWDDIMGDYTFFMETEEQTLISHPAI